ncbi:MAG: hypothetical protein IJW63_08170 [Lachnospiraceae bacterium]|nr:hypothetical protein [Lachnospiraceae bacterium]
MSDTYVECLVKVPATVMGRFTKTLLIMLTVVFGLLMLIGFWPAFFVALATGFGAYFVWLHTDIEYEYLYLDRELVIDKVMAKTKRKRVASYDLDRIEILAPVKSYHLDNYKNRQVKPVFYTTKVEEQPDLRYVMYYEGNVKAYLTPSPEMIKAMKNVAPRKIFAD